MALGDVVNGTINFEYDHDVFKIVLIFESSGRHYFRINDATKETGQYRQRTA